MQNYLYKTCLIVTAFTFMACAGVSETKPENSADKGGEKPGNNPNAIVDAGTDQYECTISKNSVVADVDRNKLEIIPAGEKKSSLGPGYVELPVKKLILERNEGTEGDDIYGAWTVTDADVESEGETVSIKADALYAEHGSKKLGIKKMQIMFTKEPSSMAFVMDAQAEGDSQVRQCAVRAKAKIEHDSVSGTYKIESTEDAKNVVKFPVAAPKK